MTRRHRRYRRYSRAWRNSFAVSDGWRRLCPQGRRARATLIGSRLRDPGLRIGQLRLGRIERPGVVLAHTAIAHRITPIDDLLRQAVTEIAQPGADLRQTVDQIGIAGERIGWIDLARIGVDAPIGAHARVIAGQFGLIADLVAGDEAIDQVAATQRTHLIVLDVED